MELFSLFEKGGLVMYPLLICSIAAIAILIERIRTYNFPQNRVTDHRIGLTLQKLDTILSGKLDEVVDALVLYDQTQKLEELNK